MNYRYSIAALTAQCSVRPIKLLVRYRVVQ